LRVFLLARRLLTDRLTPPLSDKAKLDRALEIAKTIGIGMTVENILPRLRLPAKNNSMDDAALRGLPGVCNPVRCAAGAILPPLLIHCYFSNRFCACR
jgi:hypothetical protein